MFQSILVPLDGSRIAAQALPYAMALAQARAADITLLGVVAPPGSRDVGMPRVARREADERTMATTTAYLRSMAATVRARGLTAAITVRHGDPAAAIIDCAADDARTLIVMSTHGRTGWERLRLGSIAQHVLRHATVPVMLVRAQERGAAEVTGAIGEVTVTLDGSPLAEAALPVGAHLAESLAVPLTLLRVLPRVVYPAYEATAAVSPLPIEDLERAGEAATQEYLACIAARIRRPRLAVRTVWRQSGERPPEERIIDYLTAHPTPIAVMASHGRGGVLRWALGSTVEGVLTSAPCPVVIVRAGTGAANEGGGAAVASVSEG
ncbi:MAG: universal stress protein [Thermomicrobiales bacterium]